MTEPKRPAAVTEAQHRHLKAFPACAITGKTVGVQAHHIVDFDACERIGLPELASDPRNFVTLVESEAGKPEPNLHLLAGHCGSFRSINFNILHELTLPIWKKSDAEIKADPWFKDRVNNRMKPVSEWDDDEAAAAKATALKMFPKLQGGA